MFSEMISSWNHPAVSNFRVTTFLRVMTQMLVRVDSGSLDVMRSIIERKDSWAALNKVHKEDNTIEFKCLGTTVLVPSDPTGLVIHSSGVNSWPMKENAASSRHREIMIYLDINGSANRL